MGQKSGPVKKPAEQVVREIRRATRRQFSAEEKIRIVLSGLRGEDSIVELCRREGIVQNLYYRWSKEFLEAGKKRLAGDTARAEAMAEVIPIGSVTSVRAAPLPSGTITRIFPDRATIPVRTAVKNLTRCCGGPVSLDGTVAL
jgi:transposase